MSTKRSAMLCAAANRWSLRSDRKQRKKLIDAARVLPQSPKLLRLRIAVARKLDDRNELAEATAQLEALGPGDETPSAPPAESLRALDAKPSEIPDSLPPESSRSQAPERRNTHAIGTRLKRSAPPTATSHRPSAPPGVSSRRVFRVSGAPPDADDDSDRSASEVLEACHRDYVEHGLGGPREAKTHDPSIALDHGAGQ